MRCGRSHPTYTMCPHIPSADIDIAPSTNEVDPFSKVADELSLVANNLRARVVAEVPELASSAEYFFRMGVEGKRFRPTVLLLMSTALNLSTPKPPHHFEHGRSRVASDLRTRQQRLAEITELIHVASLLHDDILDDADTSRGIGSLNFVVGNKLAVLTGDFLLSRASIALASLQNTEKTYCKTASLISNSCKAIAVLAGQTAEVATLASDYGKNLGLAFQLIDDVLDFTGTSSSLGKSSLSDIRHILSHSSDSSLGIITAPMLFAIEEFPQLRAVVDEGFDNPDNVDIALEYLAKSRGIQRTKELAEMHANLAAATIDSLPESDDEKVKKSRRALVHLTQRVLQESNIGGEGVSKVLKRFNDHKSETIEILPLRGTGAMLLMVKQTVTSKFQ
ncbi:Solanesyl diphosphate synthase 3, chloroplastic/mitochondrial [Stylosanthes scabra]|uniref:Solanesyl diphosphate synthase 3, chloroplastic/mitochondrial n=1 Tax=Stylosanthes scabra TaxID=79078 RepID=A0ABU6ZGJ4_9FABA|nr:Solanesyl diphosphate synthase 3, chloroplastic/mitochondrial [Stylosanthes scabra]